MATNRVQFQRGLSMAEFLDRYGSEEKCGQALEAARWPRGFACPACGGAARSRVRSRRDALLAVRGVPPPVQPDQRHHLPVHQAGAARWFLAMQLLTQSKNNVSALELRRQLGVYYHSAWLLKHKLMEVMRLAEDDRELDGRVEIDDAYLGGERAAASPGVAARTRCPSSRRCRPPKTASRSWRACARSRSPPRRWAPSQPPTSPPRPRSSPTVCGAFGPPPSSAPSTSASSPAAARPAWTSPQFKAINTLLGNLKTAITGTYHAFDFAKYAHRYLAEFQFRFNRRFNMRSIFHRLLRSMLRLRPLRNPSSVLLRLVPNQVGP